MTPRTFCFVSVRRGKKDETRDDRVDYLLNKIEENRDPVTHEVKIYAYDDYYKGRVAFRNMRGRMVWGEVVTIYLLANQKFRHGYVYLFVGAEQGVNKGVLCEGLKTFFRTDDLKLEHHPEISSFSQIESYVEVPDDDYEVSDYEDEDYEDETVYDDDDETVTDDDETVVTEEDDDDETVYDDDDDDEDEENDEDDEDDEDE